MNNRQSQLTSFDLIHSPLAGSHLLEASAGTGKTYSLSFIYLRLILEKALTVEEIVVATFTNAATAELKERIYARLLSAESQLTQLIENSELVDHTDDLVKLLQHLRTQFNDDNLGKRLRLAQAQFDRTQIFSLDGFATHLLQEHAITLGQSFPENIETDDIAIVQKCYLDLAHDNFSALEQYAKDLGEAVKPLPSSKLFKLLAQMLAHYPALLETAEKLSIDNTLEEQFNNIIDKLISQPSELEIIVEAIRSACESKYLHAGSYKVTGLLEKSAYLNQQQYYYTADEKWFGYFSRQQLTAKLVKKHTDKADKLFTHPFFGYFDELTELAKRIQQNQHNRHFLALMQLTKVIKNHIEQYKAEHMLMTHQDIMHVVSHGAEQLVSKTHYKAVLLDEAQDTNGEQLALFQKLFLDCNRICFFVGDPKQAIYGFRGGNVYTYLAIQNKVSHRYRLPKNFRSSPNFNQSINTLFSGKPFTQGIDYHSVDYSLSSPQTAFEQVPLTLLQADSKNLDDLAEIAAEEIIQLLNENAEIYDKKQGEIRLLQSKDIAVLVREHKQGEIIKSALSKRGLSASYLGKKSVYESDEALLIHCLLSAIANTNPREIRALLLSAFFNYSPDSVLDENLINTLRTELRQFASRYTPQYFATLFYAVMQHYQIPARLLQQNDGKRRLSNVIQIFELLQHALQKQSLSLQGLCDFLMGQIKSHDKETELRLEDENAVSIMTIHQSKGLEFPIVCLPFINHQTSHRDSSEKLFYCHQSDKAMLNNLDCPEIKQACKDEEDAEEVRLAYVALTRAIYRNIVVLQPEPKNSNVTRSNSSWHKITERLEQPLSEYDLVEVKDCSEISVSTYSQPQTPSYQAKSLENPLSPLWLMTSFSGLQQQHEIIAYETIDREKSLDEQTHQPTDFSTVIPAPSILLDFVAGAKAGTLLHSLYEHYMQYRSLDEVFIHYTQKLLDSNYPKYYQAQAATELATAIADTTKIPLYPRTFCLNDIPCQQQGIEMQFFLHLSPAARTHLYQLFGAYAVKNSLTEGYINGFIDYWFCYENKYYILDYKSNKLGDSILDYHPTAMQQAMDEHQYHLQALIYTVALCKHLDITQQSDYDQRIGGYFYLFIRGMNQQTETQEHGIVHHKINWQQLIPLLDDAEEML